MYLVFCIVLYQRVHTRQNGAKSTINLFLIYFFIISQNTYQTEWETHKEKIRTTNNVVIL
jgi:hypothetical protein